MDENKLPRTAMIAITVLRVVIGWTGKQTNDAHTLDITTDVRP